MTNERESLFASRGWAAKELARVEEESKRPISSMLPRGPIWTHEEYETAYRNINVTPEMREWMAERRREQFREVSE